MVGVQLLYNFFLFLFASSAAYSYPIATLSRTMNPYTNSILEYVSFTYKVLELKKREIEGMLVGASKDNGSYSSCCEQDNA